MIVSNKTDAENLLMQGEQEILLEIDLPQWRKLQLYLTGNALSGVELFRVGPIEARGLGFMVDFREIINSAIANNYQVFVFKNGSYLKNGNWYLKFIKRSVG